MPALWFLNNDNEFVSCEDNTYIQVLDCIQRLKTVKGEQSFYANNGIDYVGVFNGTVSIENEIYNITNLYSQYFTTKINETKYDYKAKRMYIDITFTLNNETKETVNNIIDIAIDNMIL